MKIILSMLMIAASLSVAAQGVPGQSKDLMMRPQDADANLPPSPFSGKPLPELKGVVSWKTLNDVKTVKQKDRFMPEFGKSVVVLDNKEIKLQGFMMPLDMGERQKRFILAAYPPTCSCVSQARDSSSSCRQASGRARRTFSRRCSVRMRAGAAMSDWSGKHVVVAGGSSGIGLATAHHLAKNGANITILARTQSRLDSAAAELAEHGTIITTHSVDVADRDAVFQAIEFAVGTVGGSARAHAGARAALSIVGAKGARELSVILAAAGLASNLAALRALAGEGIQKGHMRLHKRKDREAASPPARIEEVAR